MALTSFVSLPTPIVRAELALVIVTKTLDGVTTLLVVSDPDLFESVPFTRLLVESLGPVPGVAVATVAGAVAVVGVAEFGKRFCDGVHAALGTESPYTCVAQHVTYVISSALFGAAFLQNLSLFL